MNNVKAAYKHYIFGFILGSSLKIIEALFDLLIPLFMKAIIDLNEYVDPNVIPNAISRTLAYFIRSFNFGSSPLANTLTGGGIILVMGILGYVITMISQYIAGRTCVNVSCEIREVLYEKALKLTKNDHNKISTNKMLTLINSDTYHVQQGVLLFIRLIFRIPIILIGSLVISLVLDWRIGLAFVALVPLIVAINVIILRKSSKQYLLIQSDLDDLYKHTSETTEGARVIRASNTKEYENSKFENKTTSYKDKAIKVNKFNSLINPLTFALTSMVLIVIILLVKNNLFSGSEPENTAIISTIIAEMGYLAQIFFVTVQMTNSAVDITKGIVSSKRINEVLAYEPTISSKENPLVINKNSASPVVRFDDVSYAFDNNDSYFLQDLSFEIREGETFGIIGGTGSGKSTIINLIERFIDPSKGNISFRGSNLKEIDLSLLRNEISLVNQKSTLFSGTLRSNFLMANKKATDKDIEEALKKAEAYEFVSKYSDYLDHEVSEGGTNFSGGQRQRLCIARALVRKPSLLILDDSTSALDLLTDKRIRTTISNMKDMTKIIVSQRVATISNCDYILVLDKGKVVGLGNHKTLLDTCEIYKEIYHTQIKKEEGNE